MTMKNFFSSQHRAAGAALLFVFLSAALPTWTVKPATAQIRQGAAFLQFTPGARQQGIAGSLTGVIDDVHALYANPGAAGFMREWQWSATYAQWIADVYSASLIYGKRLHTPWSEHSRFALGVAYQGMADFNSTAQAGAAAAANDLVAALSFGQPLSPYGRSWRVAWGANVKYLRSKLAQYDASSWMVDTGLLFRSARFRFLNTGSNFLDYGIFSAGIAVTEVGQSLTFISAATPLPRTFRAGVAFNTGTHSGLQLHFTADYKKARDQQGFLSFGSEIGWGQIFALRGGYDFNNCLLSHFSFGLTLRLDDRNTPTSVIPGRNKAMRFDVASVEDNFLFSRTYRGSVTHQAIAPEGFELAGPVSGTLIKADSVRLAWQATTDPDLYDDVEYWLMVARDSVKLAESVNTLENSGSDLLGVLQNSKFFINQKAGGSMLQLTELEGGDYYWTVMAYDRDRHARFAGGRNRHIRHFRIAVPELEITSLTFDYHPWITEDDLQGTLQIIIKNSGDGAAKNLSLTLYDSLAALADGAMSHQPMAKSMIPNLQAGAVDTIKMEWRTSAAGLHHITARLDEENRFRESNKTNNRFRAAFYTIPKGRFTTADTALVLKQSRLAYEVPFIAEICFDSSSAEVKPDYLRQAILEPPLVTLAQRLRGNRDLKITLQGFADPNSGENDASLADARAAAVRDSLLALGVYREQVEILPGNVIKLRKPPRDATDSRWVMQERRYVNITASSSSEAVLFQLVAFNLNEPLPSPVVFTAAITGAVPLNGRRLEIESRHLREQIAINAAPRSANLQEEVVWQPPQTGDKSRGDWVGNDAAYTLILADSLNRQFRTKPRRTYLAAQSILREQRVAWPIKFRGTEPLYDFYWPRLMEHVNRLLEDKNMRMRFAGHACAIGPDYVNMKLSQQRADTFRVYFLRQIKKNYPENFEKIQARLDAKAQGFGESRPMMIEYVDGTRKMIGDNEKPLGRKLNRRLEIEFYYPERPSPRLSEANSQRNE